jgi:magnesium chelatase subunit I
VLLLIKPQFLLENLYRIADALSQKIDARGAKNVTLDYDFRVKISQICSELDVDGLRGDIVTNRAAKALAAFEGRSEVTARYFPSDSVMFRHRLRKDPLETIDSGEKSARHV